MSQNVYVQILRKVRCVHKVRCVRKLNVPYNYQGAQYFWQSE